MPISLVKRISLCSLFLSRFISPVFTVRTDSSHDITTHFDYEFQEPYAPPTPTTHLAFPPKRKYSLNDPFRIFAPPSEPVCCLIPLPTAAPVPHPADDLLPFEEWKARQLALSSTVPKRTDDSSGKPTVIPSVPDEPASIETANNILIPVIKTSDTPVVYPVEDFIPIKGRFNYASLDCSARVHSSHKSMKSASSILSSKKDKYMLAPCSMEKKDIIVELCDDIRVDTVQLANFEFFSGVFKDIVISLAHTPDVHGPGWEWEIIGVYQAKNVRGVQTFRPLNRPHAFYRYIRIEFRSHYGKEYFCPVSLLRVYGLTQMEEWRMGEWEREWQARKYPAGLLAASEEVEEVPIVAPSSPEGGTVHEAQKDKHSLNKTSHDEPGQAGDAPTSDTFATNYPSILPASPTAHVDGTRLTNHRNGTILDQGEPQAHVTNDTQSAHTPSNGTDPSRSTPSEGKAGTAKHSKARTPGSASTATPVLRPTHIPTPMLSSGGESIYRTIMNRLDMLERNSTLSLRYVEEQNYSVRQALRRLEEEVGRLRALTGREQQEWQRSMRSAEKKQAEMEKRWDMLLEQVNTLAEEVVLEKRLGMVQLCLLTTVLVFMALTRGSRAETHLLSSMRRRVDSGIGLGRGLHPRHRAQSKPRASERPFSWTRQDRRSTGDTSHQEHGSPLTPVRSGSPHQVFGTPSSVPNRIPPLMVSRSPSRQASKGVHFPQGLVPFPPPRPGSSTGMRRSQSLSLSSEHLPVSPVGGRRPATGMKRLARTAHIHEVELESQRRLRIQAEQSGDDDDINQQHRDTTPDPFVISRSDSQLTGSHLANDDPGQSIEHQIVDTDPLNTGTFGHHAHTESHLDSGAEWEDTDADLDPDDSGQELIVDEYMPAPRVPRLFSPPTPGTWGSRRKGRGFSVDTGTALRMQQAA